LLKLKGQTLFDPASVTDHPRFFCGGTSDRISRAGWAGDVSINDLPIACHNKVSQQCRPLFTFANRAF